MNFDRLAPHYRWLEILFAGGLMQRCRITHLSRTQNCRRALLAGEGTGKFLVALLQANPEIQVVCVEQSAGMIRQMRRRLRREGWDASRVEFWQMDVLDWKSPAKKFDLVVTNFFLDCFRAGELQTLVPRLAASATPDAVWLLADFCVPEHGWKRWRAKLILTLLYASFKLTTSLSADRLTPPDALLESAGFIVEKRKLNSFGLAHADLWRRTG